MQKTNLNVSPYYDDFTESKDFHRVLFRPGFSVQARELTQLQSILQNQIERHGRHVFKEGTLVIPGAIGFTDDYYAVKLQSQYQSNDISGYISQYVGKIITGTSSGVKAQVIQAVAATTDDPITLYVKYVSTGSDNVTTVFADGENISADGTISSFGANIDSAVLQASDATATGSSANIQEGVYFVRGNFVRVAEQRLILDKYTNTPSYRVGLSISETLETPEQDSSLLDNAAGSTNENAKGAHRLKMTLTLAKLALDSTADENFVELMRISNGVLQEKARNTEYSVLGETLARRTYDESGDYTVKEFGVRIRETLNDGLNDGVYNTGITTDSGNTASDDFLTVELSPGKAYVKGYEIETVGPTFIDVPKPREVESHNAAVTPVEVGNYVLATNMNNIPETSPEISGQIDNPYKEIGLFDTLNAAQGSSNGTQIGVARARAIEHHSGNTGLDILASASTTDTQFKVYLFDLRMFTTITLSGTVVGADVPEGAKVTGVNTGAYGFVKSASGTTLQLTSVVGNFSSGENLKSTGVTRSDELIEDSGSTDLTVSSVVTQDFSKVKQLFSSDTDTAFTADLVLENEFSLTGSLTTDGTINVSGFGTSFLTELRVGDIINISGVGDRVIATITDDDTLTLTATATAVTSVPVVRKRSKINDQNRNILLRKLQKNTIKTLKTEANTGISDTTVVVRRGFTQTSNASGELTITAGANETFNSVTNTDYVVAIQSVSGTPTGAAGDIVNVDNLTVTGVGSNSLTLTSASIFGNGAVVNIIATLTRTSVSEKTKTRNRMHITRVINAGVGGGEEYGTSAHHKDISLGVADVYKLHGVFDSLSTADPVLPQWTVTGIVGTFTKGEKITGGTSGAIATIINPTSPITFITLNETAFSSGETITGAESGATATLGTFTEGSRNITNDFVLDTGQRDNFYDIARLTRKPTATVPIGRLLIVCDYFSHGAGDFFTVDSYAAIDYKEIPVYSATRIDPEAPQPSGEYDLRDTVDFRPRVADITSTTLAIQNQTTYTVTDYSFNFTARSYTGNGSSTVNIPKDNSSFQYDFENYLARIDFLFLTPEGDFKVVQGAPAEQPEPPKTLDTAMTLAKINLNPYVVQLSDASHTTFNNKRYTMKDIGNLESRINNMEYYTALNLLEKDAESLQIQDSNGLDRFKSGFLVDNCAGHNTGDVKHPDYRVAMDMENKEMRPKYFMKGISLSEENLTDADRTNDNYQKTGDILTLPYTHTITASQVYATRVENLNPVLSFAWTGICKLTPSGDSWFETERAPDLIINKEGNFDTVLAENRNSLGTVWNAWQTQWTGFHATSTTKFREKSWARARPQVPFRPVIERSIGTETGRRTRSGIETAIVTQIDYESLGDRIIARALIPFCRAVNISFSATGMKPLTKVYPFFDKQAISAYVTPTGGSLGGDLVTDAAGSVSGTFALPDPKVSGNPKFRTGERNFRLTSSQTNVQVPDPETFAQAIFSATGILNTIQESIVATRNARIEVRRVTERRNVNRNVTRDRIVGWWDPLAQSFMPQQEGGEFLTKVDIFFSQKDENIPVTCQIREMQNGYPTTKVVPNGSKTLLPADVSTSSDATVATTFTFDEPVYVKNGVEHCIVLFTDSVKYLAWISRMGELDVGGSRLVSEQPYLGVLFKSQNNTTWSAYDLEDLKFNLYRAKFDTSKQASITLTNDALPVKTLETNPIRMLADSSQPTVVKINHRDHNMHSITNNVTISGVVSEGITTTLNGAVSIGATSLTINSTADFVNGAMEIKINDEVLLGTLSGNTTFTLSSPSATASAHDDGATVELHQVKGVPLSEINKTHTAIGNIGIDYYTITTTTSATSAGTVGGSSVTATENAQIDSIQMAVPTIEFPDTTLTCKLRTTSSTSVSGSQTSFQLAASASAETVPINDNYYFENPRMVCSTINETNELSGSKSFFSTFTMTSTKDNLSPVIDLDRKVAICVANRLDNVDSSANYFPTDEYIGPEEPDGDKNEAIYCTRKVTLKNPATAIKVLFDAVKFNSAEIQVMYKILRSDDASDFDELGWNYFNTTGVSDTTVNSSANLYDFVEREFTANDLSEFISFAIKIRMQGTNSTEPPRIKNIRAIALAT
jgi:hypothetical protein